MSGDLPLLLLGLVGLALALIVLAAGVVGGLAERRAEADDAERLAAQGLRRCKNCKTTVEASARACWYCKGPL